MQWRFSSSRRLYVADDDISAYEVAAFAIEDGKDGRVKITVSCQADDADEVLAKVREILVARKGEAVHA